MSITHVEIAVERLFEVMTEAGIKPWKQVAIMQKLGVRIGRGGKQELVTAEEAREARHDTTLCPFCLAEPNCGHGGVCPNKPRPQPAVTVTPLCVVCSKPIFKVGGNWHVLSGLSGQIVFAGPPHTHQPPVGYR
jgi:hypothetical protein